MGIMKGISEVIQVELHFVRASAVQWKEQWPLESGRPGCESPAASLQCENLEPCVSLGNGKSCPNEDGMR